ncbi:MAG: hypothetical protein ACLFXM_03835 [Acidimicrobiia bacterium]
MADALAPYDAASQVSESRMIVLQQNYENRLWDECYESLGVAPLRLERAPSPRERIIGRRPAHFPYLEQLETEGFPLPAELAYDDFDDGHVVQTEEQQEAGRHCHEEYEPLAEARALIDRYQPISGEWYGILAEIDALPEIVALRDEFSTCVAAEGIGPRFAADEVAFLGAVDAAKARLYDDPEALRVELRDLGQIYHRCGVDLFERKIELRLERRDEFLDEHREAITELEELLYGEGLIADSESGSGG